MSEVPARGLGPLTWLGVALAIAIGLMVILGVLFAPSDRGYYGMMGNGFGWWAALMMGIPAVFLIVILSVILTELGRTAPAASGRTAPTPLQTLEQRYAQGEVSREDYIRIREDLSPGLTEA